MADNVAVTAGSGTNIASDERTIAFDTAISVAATTDFPDDGAPAGPAANGVVCTVFYK